MPARTEYAPGTPSWVDLATPDVDGAIAFYTGLFGWNAEPFRGAEGGGFVMFTKAGQNVAGVGPVLNDEQPPAWSTYITVADADATAAAASGAGAHTVLEPMDVLDVGRLAIFVDPVGAAISIWQPSTHMGAGLVNEPGTLCWTELTTRDAEAAKAFYGAVFAWHANEMTFVGPDGSESSYTEWKLDPGGEAIGGMMVMDDSWPAELPSHWMTYFAVADTDATAAKAAELGGSAPVPPTDIPPGRMAVLNDPAGAYFTVLQLNSR